jgi:cytochrome c biogenesis protein CcdA
MRSYEKKESFFYESEDVSMTFLKEYGSFILGLILIIGGFLSFTFTGIAEQFSGTDVTRHYLLVVLGFVLISLGIVSMHFFTREDTKKSSR